VLDLEADNDGSVYAATGVNGIVKLDVNGKLTQINPFDGNPVTTVINLDSTLLLGTATGFFSLNKQSHTCSPIGETSRDMYVRKTIRSKQHPGKFYFATSEWGVGAIEGNDVRMYPNRTHREYNKTYDIIETENGEILIAARAGLLTLDGTVVKPYPLGGDWLDKQSFLLIEQGDSLWIGTGAGLYLWDGTSYEYFNMNQGLSGPEANRDAGYVDKNGRVWIGTSGGLSVFHPDYHQRLQPLFEPIIEAAYADSSLIDYSQGITIQGHLHALDIQYRLPTLYPPSQITYHQRLINLSDGTVSERETLEREALYLGLENGEYRFEVKARIGRSKWSPVTTIDPISIERKQTGLSFWLIVVTLAASLGITALLALWSRDIRAPAWLRWLSTGRRPGETVAEFLVNTGLRVLYVGERTAPWIVKSPQDVVGRSVTDLIIPDDQKRVSDTMQLQILERRKTEQYRAKLLLPSNDLMMAQWRSTLVLEQERIIALHVQVRELRE
jgi:hypothetical protein